MEHADGLPPAERLQAYLPENLAGKHYYEPGDQGAEARIVEWIRKRRSGE
jgi:replication-associated recombination protein RarA